MESTCLCSDGTYSALVCTRDATLYCTCSGALPPVIVTPDATPDLPALEDMTGLQDMSTGPSDLEDASDSGDALPDMCEDDSCMPAQCEQLLGTGELPAMWRAREIGFEDEDLRSTFGYGQGRLCMLAGGADIWGKQDRFYFVAQPHRGDFDLRARVTRLSGDRDYTKTGLMFRGEDTPDAPFVLLQLTRGQGASIVARHDAGETAGITAPFIRAVAPYWVRMIRQGDTFYAYTSPDGVQWKPMAAFHAPGMTQEGEVGFALASNDAMSYATAALDRIELDDMPDASLDCPAGIECDEVQKWRGIDVATRGGLDPDNFFRDSVITLTVTQANGQSVNTLHDALQQANNRAKAGLYTIIDVDTSRVTTPIEVAASGMPRAANVWIRGHGATVKNVEGTRSALLKLDEHVIVEGFTFREMKRGIVMDTEGGASNTRRTGLWIHHNTFEDCDEACIALAPSQTNRPRHITISHNVFGTMASTQPVAAIDASNNCAPDLASCLTQEQYLALSVHHNIFGPMVTGGYPSGGAQLLYYNNFVQAMRPPGIDLGVTGRALSRRNIVSLASEESAFPIYTNGLATVMDTDILENGARIVSNAPILPDAMYPDYFTYYELSRDAIATHLQDMAGAPAVSSLP